MEGWQCAEVPGHLPGAVDREAGVGVQWSETAEGEGPLPVVALQLVIAMATAWTGHVIITSVVRTLIEFHGNRTGQVTLYSHDITTAIFLSDMHTQK